VEASAIKLSIPPPSTAARTRAAEPASPRDDGPFDFNDLDEPATRLVQSSPPAQSPKIVTRTPVEPRPLVVGDDRFDLDEPAPAPPPMPGTVARTIFEPQPPMSDEDPFDFSDIAEPAEPIAPLPQPESAPGDREPIDVAGHASGWEGSPSEIIFLEPPVAPGPASAVAAYDWADELDLAADATRMFWPPADVRPEPAVAPTMVSLRFDDGRTLPLRSVMVVGREPVRQGNEADVQLIPYTDPERSVSKTHFAVGLARDGSVWAEDLHSTNGTGIVALDGTVRRLAPGIRTIVPRGCSVLFGSRRMEIRHGG
jgi:hypothetical protein